MRVPFSKPFEMTTSLPADEVARRLRAVVPQFMVFPVPKVWGPMMGRIGDHSCVLHLCRAFSKLPGSDIRVLDVKFFTVHERTSLQGQFRFSWGFWLMIPILAAMWILFVDVRSNQSGESLPLAALIWFAAAIGSMVYSVWISRTADTQLEEFLRNTLAESSRL